MFSRFYTIPACDRWTDTEMDRHTDRWTDRQTDRQTHRHMMTAYHASIVSHTKNAIIQGLHVSYGYK